MTGTAACAQDGLAGQDAASGMSVFTTTWPGRAGATSASLHLAGELDLAAAPLLITVATAALAQPQQRPPVAFQLDLSPLTFLDTAGLTALNHIAGLLAHASAAPACVVNATKPVLLLLAFAAAAGWVAPDIDCPQLPGAGRDSPGGDR